MVCISEACQGPYAYQGPSGTVWFRSGMVPSCQINYQKFCEFIKMSSQSENTVVTLSAYFKSTVCAKRNKVGHHISSITTSMTKFSTSAPEKTLILLIQQFKTLYKELFASLPLARATDKLTDDFIFCIFMSDFLPYNYSATVYYPFSEINECKIFLKGSKIKPEKPKYKINGARVPDGCKFEAFNFKFNRNKNCDKLKVISHTYLDISFDILSYISFIGSRR